MYVAQARRDQIQHENDVLAYQELIDYSIKKCIRECMTVQDSAYFYLALFLSFSSLGVHNFVSESVSDSNFVSDS